MFLKVSGLLKTLKLQFITSVLPSNVKRPVYLTMIILGQGRLDAAGGRHGPLVAALKVGQPLLSLPRLSPIREV